MSESVNNYSIKGKRSKNLYKCDLCKKNYKTEGGLLFHKCENKIRLNSKEELFSRIAFMAYIKFYETLQCNKQRKKPIRFEDFITSRYYNGFIKFGHYVADMKMLEPEKYIDFLIKNNVPLDKWTKDSMYEIYISQKVKSEKPDYAIEKSLDTMQKWADEHKESWDMYFEKAGQMRIVSNLRTGKISPWLVYNTKSGKRFLASLTDKDVDCMYKIIDPEYWQGAFKRHSEETKAITSVLKSAGL